VPLVVFLLVVLCSDEVLTPPSTCADVTMSVRKLLKRILLSQVVENGKDDDRHENSSTSAMQQLYNYTHGLSSDPMAMFAMTFSALIHDV
jgi:hypothetical protein